MTADDDTTTANAEAAEPELTPVEGRILACLMEKQRTTPDQYPLTLNALVLACNQKTSREPVMELDETQVLTALAELREAKLVRENSGGRSVRFEHNFQRGIGVYEQAAVLLGLGLIRAAVNLLHARDGAAAGQGLQLFIRFGQAVAGHHCLHGFGQHFP